MNKLGQEKSPYLRQHKDNPVNWLPWGNEAFQKAKSENKPIFLSIGYSTCYWCHVMEKDSFEKEDVANLLNDFFIPVKVDREERPDVDQIYMDTVVGLTGHGGWPMSVFLTPELKPFWGGTFFYNHQFKSILQQINAAWGSNHKQIEDTAERIHFHLRDNQKDEITPGFSKESIQAVEEIFSNNYDTHYGGFGGAPKFPPAMQLSYLLRNIYLKDGEDTKEMVIRTLDAMAKGGIYDQLKGGFHRYSVDVKWLVPHFEKMLYDNALLALVYLESYQTFKNENYLHIAKETLNYLLYDMRHPEGGFYAAEDAGEVNKEGEFYVWDYEELLRHLDPEEIKTLGKMFEIEKEGNFEHGKIILTIPSSVSLSERDLTESAKVRKKLLAIREKRARPHKDEKIITSWCALTVTSLIKGYLISGEESYKKAALDCTNFIIEKLFDGTALYRHYCGGRSNVKGFLEDYAFFIEALLHVYLATTETKYFKLALQLQDTQDEIFWDTERGSYFASTAEELFLKKKDYFDNATPSGNSVSLQNLLMLSNLIHREGQVERIERLIRNFSHYVLRHPASYTKFLQAMQGYFNGYSLLVIAGKSKKETEEALQRAHNEFLPFTFSIAKSTDEPGQPSLLEGKDAEDTILFYVCKNFTCKSPVKDLREAISELQNS